jgi:hypothetical protein
LYHTVVEGAVMVVESKKLDALAEELAPRWDGIRTKDQIRAIMESETYQALQEKAINLYGLSEIEAWNKVININVLQSR